MGVGERKAKSMRRLIDIISGYSLNSIVSALEVGKDPFREGVYHVYAGTSSGEVVRFECMQENDGLNAFDSTHNDSENVLKFCTQNMLDNKVPVNSLACFPEAKMLLVLSEKISAVDMFEVNRQCAVSSSLPINVKILTKHQRTENYPTTEEFGSKFALVTSSSIFFCKIQSPPTQDIPMNKIEFDQSYKFPTRQKIQRAIWINDSMILATPFEYLHLSVKDKTLFPLFSLPDPSTSIPLIKFLPKFSEILLLAENAGVLVNPEGNPTGGTLVFKSVPSSLTFCGTSVLSVDTTGQLEVYDKGSGSLLQSSTIPGPISKSQLLLAEDPSDSAAFLASGTQVFLLRPVPPLAQVKDLLRDKEYSEALQLAERCLPGEALSEAKAQAGLLMLWDLKFEEGFRVLEETEAFQPIESLRMVPELSWRWRTMIPLRRHWALHSPLQPLPEMIRLGLKAVNSSGKLQEIPLKLPQSQESQETVLLTKGISSLARYLSRVRHRVPEEQKEPIDTVQIQLYLQLDLREEVEKIARDNPKCLLANVEGALRDRKWLRPLGLILEGRGLRERAIGVWAHLARGEGQGGGEGEEEGYRGEAVRQVARILGDIGDGKLAVRHALWMIDVDADVALSVLMSPHVSPIEVLSALQDCHISIRLRYLEWLVQEQESTDGDHHTLLALAMAEILLSEGGNEGKRREERESTSEFKQKFQQFLEQSTLYNAEVVLDEIEGSDLWNEQVLLCQRLGDHISALKILAMEMEDYNAAEKYCLNLNDSSAFQNLLDIYLNPGNGIPSLIGPAVQLLYLKEGETLDPQIILEAIPAETELCDVSQSLNFLVSERLHKEKFTLLQSQLSKSLSLSLKLERIKERSHNIIITEDTRCSTCKTKIGMKLFGCFPSREVACYQCLLNWQEQEGK